MTVVKRRDTRNQYYGDGTVMDNNKTSRMTTECWLSWTENIIIG